MLDFVDCADRRLARCAAELVSAEAALPGVGVTAILPRRSYSPLLGRLLHDRTADKIAAVVSRIPHAAATIVPFDVRNRLESASRQRRAAAAVQRQADGWPSRRPATAVARRHDQPAGRRPRRRTRRPPDRGGAPARTAATDDRGRGAHGRAARSRWPTRRPRTPSGASDGSQLRPARPAAGVRPIGSLTRPGRATVEGRVYAVEIRPVERNTVLAAEIADSTGQLTALFYGRSHIPGLVCGARVRFRGQVGMRDGGPVMINPAYELLAPGRRPRRRAGSGGQPPGEATGAGRAAQAAAAPGRRKDADDRARARRDR